MDLKNSIRRFGILSPIIVRPMQDGAYEIISGHRRKHAAKSLGYRKVPVIIRALEDDDAVISMVDSNLHREWISYSEKAFAIKMKYRQTVWSDTMRCDPIRKPRRQQKPMNR